MASARARRRDKQLNTLVHENFKLHQDIEDLESAYLLHRQNVEADQSSTRGLLRKEIGGSRWEHGGAGKLTTYKVETPSEELFSPDSKSKDRDSSRKYLKQSDDLNGHGDNNGIEGGGSVPQNAIDSRRVMAFANMNSVGEDILQECSDKISDLKTKVLKKASSKIIRRQSCSNSNDTRSKVKATEPATETKHAPSKALNGSVCHSAKSRGFQRNNALKNEKAVVQKGSKTDGTKEKTFVVQQTDEKKANKGDGNHMERRSRRDHYTRSSANNNLSSTDKQEAVSNGDKNVSKQDSARDANIEELSTDVRKSIGMTYTPRKVQPFIAEHSSKVSNIFPTEPLEATEIYIDPKSGEVRVKTGAEDVAGNMEMHDGTVVLIQPGSTRKSSERNKAPCTIVEDISSQNMQSNVRDIFGLGTFDTVPKTSDAASQNVANLSSSPFAAAKDCNSEVEFWLRGLGLPDVNRYVKIFAENEIDLLDLEFMSAAQLHEMGVTGIGALDKILKGVKDLKSASSREKKHGNVRKKHLVASSIAWEDVDDETERKSNDRKATPSTSISGSVHKSCHDTNLASSHDYTTTRYERCNSALSNMSESDLPREMNADSQPSFAANTRSSSAKQTDKRPPSAKGSGGTKSSGTGQAGVIGTNRSTVKGKKTDTTSSEKGAFRGSNLESKPKKGVLLRPRSSSLNRELTSRGQGKKGQGQEEERVYREPRVRSRSADAVKRKAMEGVQAAAKKFEVKQQKHKDSDTGKHPSLRADQKVRRDKMAARHLYREKNKETSAEDNGDAGTGGIVVTAGDSPRKEEGLESLVTVNILSAPHSDPRRSTSEDMAKTHAVSKKSELQKSLRRVEPARKSSRTRPVPQLESEIEPPLLSTYKIGGRDKERDKQMSEAESGYKTDTSSTYSQVQDKVSEIQLKIKRLKARATSGDEMTLTLVCDLQGQLKQFEKQLSEKEKEIRKKHKHRGRDLGSEDRAEGRRSRSRSREPPAVITETLPQHVADRLTTPSPQPRTGASTTDRSSPTKDLSPMATATTSERSEGQRGDPDMVRMSKKELLQEMKKEKKHHHRQIRQLQTELERIRHNDPISIMELNQKDIVYDKYDLVGEGMFSKVYKGQYQGAEVALKCLKAPLQSQDKNYFTAEVSLLKELRHPRVVLLVGVCTTSKLPLMVLEYMSQGSLLKHLHDQDRESVDHALYYQIARDIAAGMNYLHSHRPEVLHLDLKSNNILLCQSFRAKIADFGFSKLSEKILEERIRLHEAGQKTGKKSKPSKQFPSSLPWMAPELLDKGEVTNKADVYSFGIILWEMLTRQTPYQDCGVFQILELVRKKKRPEVPSTTPEGLQNLIQDSWDSNPARRPQFKDVIPRLETLAFPPAWRDLFKKAGVPDAALQNLESTRKIIDIVSSTLEGSNKTVVNSFMLPRHLGKQNAGNQSATLRETTLTSSRQSSARKGEDEGSIWEAETISTLSGRLSSDESQVTVKNLKESITEDIVTESSGTDDENLSSDESYRKEIEEKKPSKIDVFIPNLELQLQSARDEFKAERSKIERISDWVSISIDDKSFRSEDGHSQRTSQPGPEVHPGFNLNLSGRSSASASSTHRYISESETLDESARREILRKQTKTKDLSIYSEDHWMRESLDNRRPPSPTKRSLSRTLSETSGSSVSEVVSTPQSLATDNAPVASSSESLPRTRSRALSNVDSSKDSFFGIPIHRQAAPTAVMTEESMAKVKAGDSQNEANEDIDINNGHQRRSLQLQEGTSARSAISEIDLGESLVVESDTTSKSVPEARRNFEDQKKSVYQKMLSGSTRSSSFSNDVEHQISSISEAFTNSRSQEKLGSFARRAKDTPPIAGRNSKSHEKSGTQIVSANDKMESPAVSATREPSRSHIKTSSIDSNSIDHPSITSDTFVHSYLNNSVTLTPQETLSSRSESGPFMRGKPERESGGTVTKSMESLSRNSGHNSDKSVNVSASFKACPEELSEARKKILFKSVQADRSKSAGVLKVSSADTGKEIGKRENVRQDRDSSMAAGKDTKSTERVADNSGEKTQKVTRVENATAEKEQVRVKLNPQELDAKRLSLSESVRLKPIELNAREKPAITPRKSKSVHESRDVNASDSLTSSQSKSVNKSATFSTTTGQSFEIEKKIDNGVRVKLVKDLKFRDGNSVHGIGAERNEQKSSAESSKDMREEGKAKPKANTIKIKLRRDPLDKMPVKPVNLRDKLVNSAVQGDEESGIQEADVESRKKTTASKVKKESANADRPAAKSSSGVPAKGTIKVKLRKDPMVPKPSQVPCSPVPPAPPPPPPSFSVANTSKSVQEQGSRMSMADEIKLRLNNRQSISEGCRVDNRGNLAKPVGRHGISSGVRPGDTIMEGETMNQNGASKRKHVLAPQPSEGLPSFMVASMDLLDQKDHLRSISKPHPNQEDELGHVSQEQLSSIADILRKAVMGRRLAMHEGADSVSQSLESTATGWSVDTGI